MMGHHDTRHVRKVPCSQHNGSLYCSGGERPVPAGTHAPAGKGCASADEVNLLKDKKIKVTENDFDINILLKCKYNT